jgi:lupus La protein
MRQFHSKSLPWLVEGLRSSSSLEVNEGGDKIRRKTEVKKPEGAFERSAYAVSHLKSKTMR